jgi:hypothetical protein
VRATFDNQKSGSTFIAAGETRAPDLDGDKLPDGWEMQHFGSIHQSTADFDSDGHSDFLEYAQGTNPVSGAQSSVPILVPVSGSPHEFIYQQITGGAGNIGSTYLVGGIQYIVEVSQDLKTWLSGPTHIQWSGRRESLSDGIERVGVHIISPVLQSSEHIFTRLRVRGVD